MFVVAWKKPSEELGELLEDALAPVETVQKRKMFGCPCFFINGNMFAGVHEDNVILRLSPEDLGRIFAEHDEAAHFEPLGRRMREYAALPDSLAGDQDFLGEWLERAIRFVSSLPPKEPKLQKKA